MYIVQTMKTEHVNPQEPKRTHKESLVVLQNSIPLVLCMTARWVCWLYEDKGGHSKPAEVPYHPATGRRVDVTKDTGVKPFGAAYHEYAYSKGYDGIGYVLSSQYTVVGVDVNDCVDEQVQLSPMAQAVIKLLDSYSEFSPSGNGIRIFTKAALGDFAGARRGSIELYNFNRHLAVTGHHIYGTPTTMKPRLEALRELYRRYLAPAEHSTAAAEHELPPSAGDNEVLEHMFAGKLGGLYHKIYHGETKTVFGRSEGMGPDESRADTLLMNALAYYTGQDATQMRRLLLSSPRAQKRRAKWFEKVTGSKVYLDGKIADSIRYSQRNK